MPVYKSVNRAFFRKWSSDMAYVLGFFFADGSLDINSRGSHYLSIQICDKALLESMKKALDSDHKIGIRKGIGTERTKYKLQIGSKEMSCDLQRLGVNRIKSKTMKLPRIPSKYLASFVRGYFDGDGHIWSGLIHKERKRPLRILHLVFTSGSDKFLKGLRNILVKYGLGLGSLCYSGRAFRLQYSVRDSIMLYHLMYGDPMRELYLSRKKDVFDKFLHMRT